MLAVLANPDARRIAILVMDGGDAEATLAAYAPSRRRHIRESLLRSGFVGEHGDRLVFVESAFARALHAEGQVRAEGIERFLRDGRIDRYPSRPGERRELLGYVAARVLNGDEVLEEREMNGRLEDFSADPAVLRRYLVDFGIVERRADGSEYARARDWA